MAVEGGKDVAMATITHLAVGITMAEATCYVLHMVVHAYHNNIIQDFVCVYLRSMTQYVRSDCGMTDGKDEPTITFEDEAYYAQDLHHPQIAKNWRGPRDLQ
uniref:Protein-binding protein n=1 Tax=Brassica oleracea TaxID=3712 RepID=B2D2I3_BRAOL|nr:protein-binding protein [Brassica oleracea]